MSDIFEEAEELEFEIVTMTDEDGTDVEFSIIDNVASGTDRYLLVVETEKMDEDETQALILKMRIYCTLYEKVTYSIDANFITKLTNGNCITQSFAHFYFFSIFHKSNHLNDIYLQFFWIIPQCFNTSLQTWNISMVIRSKQIHQ